MKLNYRAAEHRDLTALIQLLADDKLGQEREDNSLPIDQRYIDAFTQIQNDPNNELLVVECEGQLAGMLQLTFIPYLSHKGTWRCLIENVRVHRDFRGKGLGKDVFRWAIEYARLKQCGLLQLTTDKQRPDAIRFYLNLGFVASHEGMKLKL